MERRAFRHEYLFSPEDRGSLPFEQNGPKEDIDDLRVVVRICPL